MIIITMKLIHSVRGRITLLSIILILLFLCAVSMLIWQMATSYAIVDTSQNLAFTLSTLAREVGEDLDNIQSLLIRVSIDNGLRDLLSSFNQQAWYDFYDEFSSMVSSSPSWDVIERFIVTDSTYTHMMQAATNATSVGRPLRQDSLLAEVAHASVEERMSEVYRSPLSHDADQVIGFIRPILDYNSGRTLGFVFASVNVADLVQELSGFLGMGGGQLYLDLDGRMYEIVDGVLTQARLELPGPDAMQTWSGSTGSVVKEDGSYYLLTVPAPNGGAFSLYYRFEQPGLLESAFPTPSLFIVLSVLAALLVITSVMVLFLDKEILTPVRKLSQRIHRIQESDFSQDESLNTDDEFGLIGRGINELAGEVTSLMDKRVEDERRKIELEYRMLQNQINPHFLYNTFNAIRWMATLQGADGISEMITALSRLMKNISKRDDNMVPLADEVSFIDDYMLIMKYRYGNTITYVKNIPASCEGLMLPRFTLQPLVENAIFHGIEPKGTGAVAIMASQANDHWTVMVADNGVGFCDDGPKKGDGVFRNIGLDNIRQRLAYAYGDRVSFEIHSWPGAGTQCLITLRKEEDGDELQVHHS